MDLICRCEGESGIYEDGDYWVATDDEGKNSKRIPKSDNPYYPLSAVSKYDAIPINIQRLEELSIQLGNALDSEGEAE